MSADGVRAGGWSEGGIKEIDVESAVGVGVSKRQWVHDERTREARVGEGSSRERGNRRR